MYCLSSEAELHRRRRNALPGDYRAVAPKPVFEISPSHDLAWRSYPFAPPRSVLLLMLREGIALTVVGLVIGCFSAVLVTRTMKALLYGVNAAESKVFAGIALGLLVVASLACWIPARRAMKLDPMSALRQD